MKNHAHLYVKDAKTGKALSMSGYCNVEEKIAMWESKGYTCKLNGCFLYVTKTV